MIILNKRILKSCIFGVFAILISVGVYIKYFTSRCILCNSHSIKRYGAYVYPFVLDRAFNNDKNVKTDILYCRKCDFSFFELRPDNTAMAKLYKDYRGVEYQKLRQMYEPEYTEKFNFDLGHAAIKERKEHVGKILNKVCDISKIKNVLDYGGDEGQFMPDELSDCNRCVYEISNINPLPGIKKITSYDELLKQEWDFMMLCHVLEHVSDPAGFLKNEVLPLLKRGGILYIEVPVQPVYCSMDGVCTTGLHEHINFFLKKPSREYLQKIMSLKYSTLRPQMV
ncbi:hypothetical protein FACS189449_07010 [Alphaproteobacteria bacterium]|nr:hypothetical protein FACS189449_07010 [Alphaproteobacteria bacterium]